MRKFFLVLTVIAASASTCALVQSAKAEDRGTDAEQKACTRDVVKHCRSVMEQGDLVVLSCLKEHRPKISKACNAVLVSHGQ